MLWRLLGTLIHLIFPALGHGTTQTPRATESVEPASGASKQNPVGPAAKYVDLQPPARSQEAGARTAIGCQELAMTDTMVEYALDSIRKRLTLASYAAQREFPVVGTAKMPTPWDNCHRAIDNMLTELERASVEA